MFTIDGPRTSSYVEISSVDLKIQPTHQDLICSCSSRSKGKKFLPEAVPGKQFQAKDAILAIAVTPVALSNFAQTPSHLP